MFVRFKILYKGRQMALVQEQHISGTQVTATRTARFTEAQTSQNLTANGQGAHRLIPLSEKSPRVVGFETGCPCSSRVFLNAHVYESTRWSQSGLGKCAKEYMALGEGKWNGR